MKNMKTIFSKLFVLALAGAFFAGCSNTFDVAEGATGSAAQPAGYVKVLLGSEVSRTILPDEWVEAKKAALYYYLSGTGVLSDGVTEKEYPLTKLDYAKISASAGQDIELSPGVWELTLSAYQLASAEATPTANDMVLTAKISNIDLTEHGETQAFKLKPVSSTQAKGTVNISGSVACGPYLKSIVQDVGTISGDTFTSAASGAYKVTQDVSSSTATSTSLSFSYSKDVVASSDYWYVIDFFNANNELLGHYEEALIVDGGNISSKTIALGDYLNSPATNPATLAVTTNFDNKGQAVDAAVPNTFEATFKWDDKSANETGFELKIYKGTVTDGVTTYPTETELIYRKGGDKVVIGTGAGQVKANSNAAGDKNPTFGKNETQATIYLETGYTYKATIRAYNRYDDGDASDTPTKTTAVNGTTGTDMEFGMFTVAYTLGDKNAFVKTGTEDTDKVENPMFVAGYNYSAEAQTPMGSVNKGASATVSTPYVTTSAENIKFKKWITTVASMDSDAMDAAEAVTSIAAKNITNLKLTGVWKSVANVSVTFPSYDSLRTLNWMKSYQVGDAAAVTITSNELVVISGKTTDKIVLTYDETKVSDVTARASGAATAMSSDASEHTVTFDATKLSDAEGEWNVTVTGTASYEDDGETKTSRVSQSFRISLE